MILVGVGAAIGLSGCYVYADPVPVARVETSYEPMFYEGNPVYYDDAGAPFIYVGAGIHYIPTTYVSYGLYVNHYHRYQPGYRTWVRTHGPSRHHQRAPAVRHRRR